ncbi:MAG: hypothetical protein M3371_04610, partial [Acidobacteriota bacterium]|nr:hypothetical protein [Acidobacteriota bacterium]
MQQATLLRDFLKLASHDQAEREAALIKNRFWFDCEEEVYQTAVREISSMEEPSERLEMVQEWRRRSAEVYYRNLESKLTQRRVLSPAAGEPTRKVGGCSSLSTACKMLFVCSAFCCKYSLRRRGGGNLQAG